MKKYLFAALAWLLVSSAAISGPFAISGGGSSGGGGSGTVTSVGVTTGNGVSGFTANPTTTPRITLTLGAITPSTVTTGTVTATTVTATSIQGTLTAVTGTLSSPTLNTPTLVAPALGTPTSGVATNLTGTASGLTAGTATHVTTNANLTGPITSSGNATAIGAQTGTGSTFVMQSSPTINTPTFVAPALGTPSSGTLTNATGLPTTGLTGTLQAAQFPALTGDATTSAGALAVTLANTAVSAGTCTACNLTIDAKGRITAQATGSASFSGALGSNNLTGTGTANRIGTATTNDTAADWMFSASGTTKKPVVIQASPSTTASVFEVQASDGTIFGAFQRDGNFLVNQQTGNVASKPLEVRYQNVDQFDVSFSGLANARVGFNGGGGFFTTDGSGNVVALGTITGKHLIGNGTSPTVGGSCGSSPAIAGHDLGFTVTAGTGSPTSCAVTFGTAGGNSPHCSVTGTTVAAVITARSTTAITISSTAGTLPAGEVLDAVCTF